MKDNLTKIIFLLLCIISLITKDIHFSAPFYSKNEIEINEMFADALYTYKEVTGQYPGFDNFQLNYENECSKYFRYLLIHIGQKNNFFMFLITL